MLRLFRSIYILSVLSVGSLSAQSASHLCLDGFCVGQSINDPHFDEVNWIVPKDLTKEACGGVGCKPEVAFRGYSTQNQNQLGEALSLVYGLRVYNIITKTNLGVLRQYRYECNLSPRGIGSERRFLAAYFSSPSGYLTVIGLRLIGGELRVYRIVRQYPYRNQSELDSLARKLHDQYRNEVLFYDYLSSNAYSYVIEQRKDGWFGRSTMFNPRDLSDNAAELVLIDPNTRPMLEPTSMPDSGEIKQLADDAGAVQQVAPTPVARVKTASMTAYNVITITSEALGALAGFYAAYCWWIASTARIDPGWTVEPGESDLSQAGWTAGIMNSLAESAKLNRKAALWTALSVLLTTVPGILSALASFAH